MNIYSNIYENERQRKTDDSTEQQTALGQLHQEFSGMVNKQMDYVTNIENRLNRLGMRTDNDSLVPKSEEDSENVSWLLQMRHLSTRLNNLTERLYSLSQHMNELI